MAATLLAVALQVNSSCATANGWLYYKVSIQNSTLDSWATQLLLNFDISDNFVSSSIAFTLDGTTWLPYSGTLNIDDLAPLASGDIVIKGQLKPNVSIGQISYNANVDVVFCQDVEKDSTV